MQYAAPAFLGFGRRLPAAVCGDCLSMFHFHRPPRPRTCLNFPPLNSVQQLLIEEEEEDNKVYWNRENLHNNKECEVKNGLTLGLVSPSTSAAYRPLSMNACRSLARSTHQPSKIVYANAKQSPMNEERCVVNPPLSPSLLVSSSGTSWVHDSRDSWRRHLEEREREGGREPLHAAIIPILPPRH